MRKAFIFVCLIGFAASAFAQATVSGAVSIERRGREIPDRSSAVVWLTPIGRNLPPEIPTQTFRLTQKDKRFTPHLLVIPQGALVEFPNKDIFFHNVFSLHDGVRFDLGLYERGTSKVVRFSKPGASYIFCNIHPEMSAVIMVMNTRFYAVSNREGNYQISNVPPGEYELSVWYERAQPEELKSFSHRITVANAPVNLGSLKLHEIPGLADHHKNKFGMDYESQPTYP